MGSIVSKISEALISNGIIQEDDMELYQYGLELLLSDVFIGASMLVIGTITGQLAGSLLFCFSFYTLRAYCGGYHCKSFEQCCFVTIGIFTSFLVSLAFLKINVIMTAATAICACICYKYSPVQHRNRVLSTEEMFRCRSISRVLILISILVYTVAIIKGLIIPYMCISCALIATGILIILYKMEDANYEKRMFTSNCKDDRESN